MAHPYGAAVRAAQSLTMWTVLAALALLPATVVSPLAGQGDDELSRKTLVGLSGGHVVVNAMSEDARRDGLSETYVQADVELKLRQAGASVLTDTDVSVTPPPPLRVVILHTV